MMDWKTAFRSFYYETADLPEDIKLNPVSTALLVFLFYWHSWCSREAGDAFQ